MELNNLSELKWCERGQWPIEIKVTLCFLVAMLTLVSIYYLFAKPEFERYEQLLVEETKLKTEFEKKYNQTVNVKVYRKQWTDMQGRFGALLRELPTKNEMPILLEDLAKTGTSIGLMFDLFDPKSEIVHPFYIEVPVDIRVSGTYHQMAVFLSRIAQISRIVTLHDFVMTRAITQPDAVKKGEWQEERLELALTIKIYRYRA